VTAEAARVTCPTLVLHCTGDEGVPLACGREMASLIPGARFVPLTSRNHILLENEPAWRHFLDEVRAFLPKPETGAFTTLTPRERAMLDLVARGLSNGQIATLAGLSEKTVKNRITSIFAKLKVKSRPQAIVLAREAGFGLGPSPGG
jgi:DNA-binding NarL/FixJ family response regulator